MRKEAVHSVLYTMVLLPLSAALRQLISNNKTVNTWLCYARACGVRVYVCAITRCRIYAWSREINKSEAIKSIGLRTPPALLAAPRHPSELWEGRATNEGALLLRDMHARKRSRPQHSTQDRVRTFASISPRAPHAYQPYLRQSCFPSDKE